MFLCILIWVWFLNACSALKVCGETKHTYRKPPNNLEYGSEKW